MDKAYKHTPYTLSYDGESIKWFIKKTKNDESAEGKWTKRVSCFAYLNNNNNHCTDYSGKLKRKT